MIPGTSINKIHFLLKTEKEDEYWNIKF